jgi:hypothetical protein
VIEAVSQSTQEKALSCVRAPHEAPPCGRCCTESDLEPKNAVLGHDGKLEPLPPEVRSVKLLFDGYCEAIKRDEVFLFRCGAIQERMHVILREAGRLQ